MTDTNSPTPPHTPDEEGWCQNEGCMWNVWNAKSTPGCPVKLAKRAGTVQEQEDLLHGEPTPPQGEIEQLREKLAAIEHERWADWQRYVHSLLDKDPLGNGYVIRYSWVDRWNKQIETPYAQLTPGEQASDMEQVDRYWPLITAQVHEAEARGRREALTGLKDLWHIRQATQSPGFPVGILDIEAALAALQDTTGEGEK